MGELRNIKKGSCACWLIKDENGEIKFHHSTLVPDDDSGIWNVFPTYFIAIPKTGTHGIIKKMDHENVLGHLFGREYPSRIKHKLRTIVRNPYDRLVSAYFFMRRGGFSNSPRETTFHYDIVKNSYSDFEDWVLRGLHSGYFSYDGLLSWTESFLPQTEWLLDENGELVLEDKHIGRFENLTENVKKLLGIDLDTHENASSERDRNWKTYYTNPLVREKVEQLYKKDFEILGYEKFLG